MCANHSTTRAILPHFTGLTDRLPYGSGGFLLYQDSVVSVGIEPTTHRFSVCCSTNWATTPIASAYLCKGCRGTDYPSLLFCCPGRTRTSIKWLTVTRNNLYTTRQFLTTTWLLSSLWNSYHSFLVVQGCRSSSLHLSILSSRFRNLTTVASPCFFLIFAPFIQLVNFWNHVLASYASLYSITRGGYFVAPRGIEPHPYVLQTYVQTTYTREPNMIMLEYPSRSNLNCLFVVLRCTGRGWRIL